MSTQTATVFPIVGALREAVRFKKASDESWEPLTESQKTFVKNVYRPLLGDMSKFNDSELKYLASFSHEEINNWMSENGFDIKLEPFQRPTDFGAASIQDVKVEWIEKGIVTNQHINDVIYPSVLINRSRRDDVKVKKNLSVHPHQVAKITTKNGDVVMMTIATEKLEHTELLNKVKEIYDATEGNTYSSAGDLTFPCIDLDDKPNIEWLKGMGFAAQSAVTNDLGFAKINQALQQTFFKMNETGARVKSAVAVSLRFECAVFPDPPMVIDKPFYLSITRPGMDYPYFAAYLDYDCWKNPESLKMPGDKEKGTQE